MVNHVLPVLFYVTDTSKDNPNVSYDIIDRIKDLFPEFLALSSLSLLQLGQQAESASNVESSANKNNNNNNSSKVTTSNKETVYLILEKIVSGSPYLGGNDLELCFPYVLLRNAFQSVRQVDRKSK